MLLLQIVGSQLQIKTSIDGATYIPTITTSGPFIKRGWNLIAYQLLNTDFILMGWPNFGPKIE